MLLGAVESLIGQPSGQCLCSQSMAAPSKPSAVYAMPQSKKTGTKAQANRTCPIASFAARMGQAPPVMVGALP